jgi:hypothetical protein
VHPRWYLIYLALEILLWLLLGTSHILILYIIDSTYVNKGVSGH